MAPAAEGLARVLESVSVQTPAVGVVTNVTADVNRDPARIKNLLVQQVTAPVRWEESMQKLQSLGCNAAVEVGPGRVLAGLLKRIVPEVPCVSVNDLATLAEAQGVLG
jgi:[acyl-carrier-protein] S-malonyltransferase